MSAVWRIEAPVGAGAMDEVAGVLEDAFAEKIAHELHPRSPEQLRRILLGSLDPACCIAAFDEDGSVVGLAGVAAPGRPFMHLTFGLLRREFGVVGATPRWLYSLVELVAVPRRQRSRRVEVLAVREDARGRGIGSALIAAAVERAAGEGADRVLLEVVDTNGRARALYERLGFRCVRTVRSGVLTGGAGYRAVHFMRLDL